MHRIVILAVAAGVLLPTALAAQAGKDRAKQQPKTSGPEAATQLVASFRVCDTGWTCSHVIALEWAPVQRATEYRVYRSFAEAGPFEQLTTELAYFGYASPPPTTSISDASRLRPATHYYYRVGAVMEQGQEKLSNVARVLTPEVGPPLHLTGEWDGYRVVLKWGSGFGVDGHRVCRSDALDGPYVAQGGGPLTLPIPREWRDSKVVRGRTYYYRVLSLPDTSTDDGRHCAGLGLPFAEISVLVPAM